TSEFAFRHPGETRNPHNLNHTPGGSSSGSAAAVAANMVSFALSTQTGGSIIRPAAYCGVFGFKPSFGLISRDGMQVMCESLDVIGWHANTLEMTNNLATEILPFKKAAELPETIKVAVITDNSECALQDEGQVAIEKFID